MKATGVILMVLGLAVAIVPQFFTCQYHGFAIHCTQPELTIPMKCLWTAHAMIPLGILLVLNGGGIFLGKERETRRILSISGIIIGIFVGLLVVGKGPGGPLIGICMNPDMPCVVIMQPACFLMSGIIIVVSIVVLALTFVRSKLPAEGR